LRAAGQVHRRHQGGAVGGEVLPQILQGRCPGGRTGRVHLIHELVVVAQVADLEAVLVDQLFQFLDCRQGQRMVLGLRFAPLEQAEMAGMLQRILREGEGRGEPGRQQKVETNDSVIHIELPLSLDCGWIGAPSTGCKQDVESSK
jgi:hypothetical protein